MLFFAIPSLLKPLDHFRYVIDLSERLKTAHWGREQGLTAVHATSVVLQH